MKQQHAISAVFDQIRKDLRMFIDLSIEENDISWGQWMASMVKDINPKCWEEKKCNETGCPAYKNECGRCWLIAGTMCGGEVQGIFAKKYVSCKNCDIYQKFVYCDPVTELQEHLIVLVHSLRTKQYELQEMAITDALTSLHNRRFFDLVVHREIAEINRLSGKFYIIMIDINNFKQINDTRGHLYGDYILKEFAAILRNTTRNSDLLIRFGGDEFLMLVRHNSFSQVQQLIDRISEQISLWNNLHAVDEVTLSISVGVSEFKAGGNIDEAINQADKNMYLDKEMKKK